MLYAVIFSLCVFAAVMAGILSALSDYKGLVIPNRYSVIVILSFFIGYAALYAGGMHIEVLGHFLSHLMAAAIVFVITFIMFALNVWGAADSKLSLSYALWLGFAGVFDFIVVMTIVGGALGVVAIIFKHKKPWPAAPKGTWLARVQEGESVVPYGIAIVCGALYSFVAQGYCNLPALFAG